MRLSLVQRTRKSDVIRSAPSGFGITKPCSLMHANALRSLPRATTIFPTHKVHMRTGNKHGAPLPHVKSPGARIQSRGALLFLCCCFSYLLPPIVKCFLAFPSSSFAASLISFCFFFMLPGVSFLALLFIFAAPASCSTVLCMDRSSRSAHERPILCVTASIDERVDELRAVPQLRTQQSPSTREGRSPQWQGWQSWGQWRP